MVDRETLRELRSLFCALVPDSQTLQMLAEDAGISTVNIVLDGSLESKCSAILKEANRQGAEVLLSLVDEMVERNPTRSELRAVWRRLCAQTGQPSLESSTLTDDGFMETPCRWARYRLRRVIGKGGMGVVYRARVEADSDFDMETTQGGQEPIGFPAVWVALKLLHHTRIARRHHRRSFIDEMYTLAQLSHPNIVRLNRVGTGPSSRGDIPYLEMELIEGGSLAQYLEREAQDEAQLTKPLQAVRFIRKIAAALAYLHDEHHILHLDLKPSNVLLHHDEPKLVDFGLALPQRSAEGNAIPARGVTLGFSSPEQIEGRPVGPASDLFSLGALLWSMLSRDWPPRERRHLSHRTAWLTRQDLEASERFAQLDAPLQALLLDLTREEPHERPSSAAKVVTRCDVVSEALYIAPYQAEFQRERKALTALLQSEKATREELRNRIETRLTELE